MKTITLVISILSIIFIKNGNNLKMAVNIPPFTVNLGRIKMPTIMITLKGSETLNMPSISISASTGGHSNDNWYPETYYNHPYRNQPLYDLENWGSHTSKEIKNADWRQKNDDLRLKRDEHFKNDQLNNAYSLEKNSYKNYNQHIIQTHLPFKKMSYPNNIHNDNLHHKDHAIFAIGRPTNSIGQSLNSQVNLIKHQNQQKQITENNGQVSFPSYLLPPHQWNYQKNPEMLTQQINNENPVNIAPMEENLENYKDDEKDEENEL